MKKEKNLVNNRNDDFFQKIFEGAMRQILSTKFQTPLFMFNNVQYNDDVNARRAGITIRRSFEKEEWHQLSRIISTRTTGGTV